MADSRIKSDIPDLRQEAWYSPEITHPILIREVRSKWIKNLVQGLYRISFRLRPRTSRCQEQVGIQPKGDIFMGRKSADDLIECTVSADCDQSKGLMDFRRGESALPLLCSEAKMPRIRCQAAQAPAQRFSRQFSAAAAGNGIDNKIVHDSLLCSAPIVSFCGTCPIAPAIFLVDLCYDVKNCMQTQEICEK